MSPAGWSARWRPEHPLRRLAMIAQHTDAKREYCYDRKSDVGKLDRALDAAPDFGWIVMDMARDWATIFPTGQCPGGQPRSVRNGRPTPAGSPEPSPSSWQEILPPEAPARSAGSARPSDGQAPAGRGRGVSLALPSVSPCIRVVHRLCIAGASRKSLLTRTKSPPARRARGAIRRRCAGGRRRARAGRGACRRPS